jgi:hypothetical protein
LTSALDAGDWSPSCPGRFTHKEKAPGTHLDRRLGGPRAGLNAVAKRNSQPLPGLESPIIQPEAQRYTTELFCLVGNETLDSIKGWEFLDQLSDF